MSLPFMRNESGFITIVEGQSYVIHNSHTKYGELLKAVKDADSVSFLKNCTEEKAIQSYLAQSPVLAGKVELKDGVVLYDGREVHSTLASRIIEFQKEDLPFEPLLKFMEKLYQNPSSRAISELFDFLENKNLPITPDGDFLAYKGLQTNYYSVTGGELKLIKGTTNESGHIYNGVGEEIQCERNAVDDDRDQQCSYGLHVGGLNYSGPGKFGSITVIVKVNPADVIAVPKDYNAQKARVCHYIVVEDYKAPLPDTLSTHEVQKVDTEWDDYIDTYDDDDYEEWYDEDDEVYEGMDVTVEQVRKGDEISFDYRGVQRWLSVEQTDSNLVHGSLIEDDPKFDDDDNKYRNFSKSLMFDIKVIN